MAASATARTARIQPPPARSHQQRPEGGGASRRLRGSGDDPGRAVHRAARLGGPALLPARRGHHQRAQPLRFHPSDLLALMVPYQAILTPAFLELNFLRLTNSLLGLILFYSTFGRYLQLVADTPVDAAPEAYHTPVGGWREPLRLPRSCRPGPDGQRTWSGLSLLVKD